MEAYAALLSLLHTIEQIQHHPSPPISIDNEQYESLTENITFLLGFLEGYSYSGSNEAPVSLEIRIADAAYAAEDIIESQIVDQILRQQFTVNDEYRAIKLCEGLEEVIRDIEFLRTKKMKIGVQDQQQPARSSRSRPTSRKKNNKVSLDDVLMEILDKLIGGQLGRQIIPIVGMGGVGKTTLAQYMYVDSLVEQYFDIRAWTPISQEYSRREILSEIVGQVTKQDMITIHEMTDDELGENLYKHLWGRRYLIVMDDMWSIDAWDKIKFFFPECSNGSRIVVTTRLSNLASQLTSPSNSLEMKLWDEVKSWNLFSKIVFEEEGECPFELVEIGKEIARHCRGLPLSIVVIGGLLAESNHTRKYWEYIVKNLNFILSREDDERCFKILYMSYTQLPVHLKPCFLYMGVYPEDHAIRASTLMELWIEEGFVRPISGKCLEEVAKEYLRDLVDRNLIMVDEWGSTGNIKHCKIHDLLRDLCLEEAYKDSFYYVATQPTVHAPKAIRRRVISGIVLKENVQSNTALVRTLIWNVKDFVPSLDFKLLRIFKYDSKEFWFRKEFGDLVNVLQYVNLRYVNIDVMDPGVSVFPSSVSLMWNLQTLFVNTHTSMSRAPVDIWKMPQLRHVKVEPLDLPADDDQEDVVVLCNLQTLGTIRNFMSGEVVKRIPNIKKLKINHFSSIDENYHSGLDRLHKLESLYCLFAVHDTSFLQSFTFPQSLKKLTLIADYLQLEDVMDKIGSLPLLEKFKGSFQASTWETVEGQFRSLKFLEISFDGLESWETESTHFPCLEHLVLVRLPELMEIPSDIGEISTLQSIKLEYCSKTTVVSAKRILEQQEEFGGVGLRIRVRVRQINEAILQSLASHNFRIEYDY